MIEEWPALRLQRAIDQLIECVGVESTDDGNFIFNIRGSTGQPYLVKIHESVDLWLPYCTCEDNFWRPELLCKHQVYCLRMMGVDEERLLEWGKRGTAWF